MKIGAIFPHTEIGSDPGAIRAYAAGIEQLGAAHVTSYDHVLGAGRRTRPDFAGPFDNSHAFHELFTLFAFIAAVTTRIELASGVLVLPQRQTALVAKQAAEVDLLSGGRLRLGVGVGWNAVEYTGLGAGFTDRGRRFEEQVSVLRALWTEPEIEFDGDFHTIPDAGLNPRPVQAPIPLWIGTSSPKLLGRVARIGDGWIPFSSDAEEVRPEWTRLQELAAQEGRARDAIGLEGHLILREHDDEDGWQRQHETWSDMGATHLSIATGGLGLQGVDEHLELLGRLIGSFGATGGAA